MTTIDIKGRKEYLIRLTEQQYRIVYPEFNDRQIKNITRSMSIFYKDRKSYQKSRWKKKYKRLMDKTLKYGVGMKISHRKKL